MDKYIGKMLDNRYEILEVIGTGGMAVVYKARCHRLNRLVAVKILKDEFTQDADFRRRFHMESHAVAMLSHPNIVAVYDVSRSSDVEYIIMELIDGITLKQYMQKKGQLNWRESLHFVTQIVKALSHAHGRGIIHRDIKPHNIMILRDGSVKVADFGIARFASMQNTLTQEALGSVHYISPEQARGSHIDARSDLYSVGVVLYEMLTSRLPFEGDSPVSVAIQHINSMPVTPRDINPEIPDALEVITMKAMSPKLSRRYSSAETMLHDLEEFRKNPSIIFDYDRSEWHETADETDEPTRYMKTGETQMVVRRSQEIQSDRRARELEKKRVRRQIEQEEDYRVKKNNSLIAVLSGVLAVLLFIAGMAYLIITIFNGSTGPDDSDTPNSDRENVTVPRLTGRLYDDVLNDPDLPDLAYILDAEESNARPAGEIIAQDPSPNRSVRPGSDVLLTVSTGPKSFTLDDYTGREYRAVQMELSQLKLRYNAIPIYQSHPTLANGMVIETRPAANTPVYENDSIELVVSSGPVARKVEMPDLLGKTEEEAIAELTRYKLNQGSFIMVDSDKPAGTVVVQSHEAGTLVDEGTPVDLSFSLGPVETPPPTIDPGGETPLPDPNNPTDPIVPPTGDPGVTPTPDPNATPTPDPGVTPAPELLTRTMPITLPQDKAEALVEIRVNNTVAYQGVEPTTQGTIYREVTGAPTDAVYLYIDGVIRWSGTVEGVGG